METLYFVSACLILAVWATSVEYRCTSARARRWLRLLVGAMAIAIAITALHSTLAGSVTVIIALVIAAAVEVCFITGVIPSAHGYRHLFRNLPFDVKIVNPRGRAIYQTDAAQRLDSTTLLQLAQKVSPKDKPGTMVPTLDPKHAVLYKTIKLHAGAAVISETTSEIEARYRSLEQQNAILADQNKTLEREREIQRFLARQQREQALSQKVEQDLASTASQIRSILDNLPPDDDESQAALRQQNLNLVKALVAYSKRKGMLALASAESDTIRGEALDLVAHEAMADLSSIGIDCGVLVNIPGTLSVEAANLLYDYFYDCIIGVLPYASPVVMASLTALEGQVPEMRTTIECAIGLQEGDSLDKFPKSAVVSEPWIDVQNNIARDIEARLQERGGSYELFVEDGLVNVRARAFPDPELDVPGTAGVPGTMDVPGTAGTTGVPSAPGTAGATGATGIPSDPSAQTPPNANSHEDGDAL